MQPVTPTPNETRLPRAVVRRMEGVTRLQRMQRGEAEPETPAPAVVDAAPATPAATPAPPAAPAVATPATPNDPREDDPAYWRQRFNVTAGVLKRERELHAEEVTTLQQRIVELKGQLEEAQQATPTPSSSIDLGKYMTPEQIERIGEDDARVIAETAERAAASAAQAAINKIVTPMREERERSVEKEIKDKQRAFLDKLIELVPDYELIDQDPGFLEWLSQEDESSGVERQQLLTHHTAAHRAVKVAKFFMDWKKLKAPPAPPITAHAHGGQNDGGGKQPTLLRPLTKVEIKSFYTRAALSKVTAEERAEFEARRAITPGQ